MRIGRLIAAALLGGLVTFVWGAASHMVLPIGEMGITDLPAEQTLLPVLNSSIPARGLYFFPGMGHDTGQEAMKAWEEKIRQGPRGLLIFEPAGGEPMAMSQLGIEFGSNVLAAFFAAMILARVAGTRWSRTLAGTAIGLIAWLSINVSYWNWYLFPSDFVLGELIGQTVGWFLTGGVIALTLDRSMPKTPVAETA